MLPVRPWETSGWKITFRYSNAGDPAGGIVAESTRPALRTQNKEVHSELWKREDFTHSDGKPVHPDAV